MKGYDIAYGTEVPVETYLIVILPLILFSVWLWRVQVAALNRHTETVTGQIVSSGLIDRLGGPTEWVEDIFDWTPVVFARVFVGRRSADLQGRARALAMNIDWYLEKPKKYMRPEWYLIIPALVIAIAWLFIKPGWMEFSTFYIVLLIGIPILVTVLLAVAFLKLKQRRTMEILREMLEVVDS